MLKIYKNGLILSLIIFFSANLYAQGAGTASLITWYKANAGTSTTTDNAEISTWNDQASGGYNATQSGARRPRYQDSSDGINFNPYISFDGTEDFFNIPNNSDFNTSTNDEKSYTIVFRTGIDITTRQFLFEEGGGTRGLNIYIFNGELYVAGWNRNNDGLGAPWQYRYDSVPIDTETVYIATVVYNGNALILGTLNLNLNGQNEFTITNVGRLYAHGANIGLGAKDNASRIEPDNNSGGDGFYTSTDIAEFLYYNAHALSATDTNILESYLAIKYGVTLDQTPTEDYVDYNSNTIYDSNGTHISYIHDIAGIGNDSLSGLVQTKSRSVNNDSIVIITDVAPLATNGEFLVWGNNNDDNATIEEITAGVPTTVSRRLDRVWRVDQTGDVGAVDVQFDVSGLTVTGTSASDFALLVDTSDSDFTSGATIIPASSFAAGIVTFSGVDFTGDDFFTLATEYAPTPPTVTLSSSNYNVPENGGVASIIATLSNTWTSDVTVTLSFSGSAVIVSDYSMSGLSITIPSGSLTGNVFLTGQNDAFSEGIETAVIDISTVINGSEDGVQQINVNINDDEPDSNSCGGEERIFTTELNSGDVNVYFLEDDLPSVMAGDDDTSFTVCSGGGGCNRNFVYEMDVDSENSYIYMASYDDNLIYRVDISDLDNYNVNTHVQNLYTGLAQQPFQIAIHNRAVDTTVVPNVQVGDKVFWSDWSTSANLYCANADGTGTPVVMDTGLYYPTGIEIDKDTNRLYVNFGYDSPTRLDVYEDALTADGSCNPSPTITNLITNGDNVDGIPGGDTWPLGFNITVDPPGDRLYIIDCNNQNIMLISNIKTPPSVSVDFNIYNITNSGTCFTASDAGRDIAYNKNTDNIYWVQTDGEVHYAPADGSGPVTQLVSNGGGSSTEHSDSRSINMCFDEVPPRLVSFNSSSADGTYCPGSTINITAVYDESLKAGSTLTVELDNGVTVVLNNISGNEISGTYTVGATGSGQDSSDLTVSVITSESVSDTKDNETTLSTVADVGNMNIEDTSDIIVDTTAPVVSVVTPVSSPTLDRTPDITINTDTAGTLTFGGSCASTTTVVSAGNNTFALGANPGGGDLPDGTYSDCTITVTEANSCNQTTINVPTFTVAADIPEVTLTIDKSNIDESGTVLTGQAIVTASLSNVYGANVTVNFAFSGTAEGSDYTASANSVVISAGSSSNTISITSTTDAIDEDDETVIVDIDTLVNATEGSPNQVTTTITDDDPPPSVTITVDKANIDESGSDGSAVFTLTLSTLSERTITVGLAFSGTAVDADITQSLAALNSVTINPGSSSGSITVTPFDDTLFESDESLIVDIDTVTNVTEGSPNQATTTILEDVLCNQNPWSAPASGYTDFFSVEIGKTFASGAMNIPDGDNFDAYINSKTAFTRSADELQTLALEFFLNEYGIDFTGGSVDGNGDLISADGTLKMRHISFNDGGSINYDAKVHSAKGYKLAETGGDIYGGIYQVIVINPTTTFNSFTGNWGGTGIPVPFGTIVEYGEFFLELHTICSDNDTENYTSDSVGTNAVYNSDEKIIAFSSLQPSLADYDGMLFNDAPAFSWLDIPQIYEHNIIAPDTNEGGAGDNLNVTNSDYSLTGGQIRGWTQLRDDGVDVEVKANILIYK